MLLIIELIKRVLPAMKAAGALFAIMLRVEIIYT